MMTSSFIELHVLQCRARGEKTKVAYPNIMDSYDMVELKATV